MSDSAIAVGGLSQLMASVIFAMLAIFWLPISLGDGRMRIAAAFVVWQSFTPARDSFLMDMAMFAGFAVVAEFAYRRLAR